MENFTSFDEFLTISKSNIPLLAFVVNLLIVITLTAILGWIYQHYGNSLSNRKLFARNFILLSASTMIIISIIKSSLALSLGLVGALSIIRYRVAIKEPEELTYLFLAITIGLGFGANQSLVTIFGTGIIIIFIILRSLIKEKIIDDYNLHITVTSQIVENLDIVLISELLKEFCTQVELKRLDQTKDIIEASFLIYIEEVEGLEKIKSSLKKIDPDVKISFLDIDNF